MRDPEKLIVFARAPVAGHCKTRLIPRLGGAGAATLAAALLRDVCALARAALPAAPILLCVDGAGAIDHPLFAELCAAHALEVGPQVQGDLGARMAAALDEGLARARRVCIIGSDSPTLPPTALRRAFARLDSADAVLGPADDGGYWLVGSRRPIAPLFVGIRWGGPTVLDDTLARARRAGVAVELADRHWDVDEPLDLDRLAAALDADPAIAPATRAALG